MSAEQNPARPDDDQTVSLLARTRTLCGQCSNDVDVDGIAIAVFASDTSGTWCTQPTSPPNGSMNSNSPWARAPALPRRTSVPETQPDVADPAAATRWPMLVPEVLDLGVRAVFAFPLRLFIGAHVGVLELYRTQPGRLDTQHDRAAAGCAAALGPIVVEELNPSRNPTMVDPALCKHSSLSDGAVAAFASFREICSGPGLSGHLWLVAAGVMSTKEV
ncbi:hypothetical protein L1080_028250 [Rhodococcus sp. MSC1_016]|uniref:hypothetical protein n=1 Tax=Rhodococcus sp. MSC1_016 TaxID=2909266 RepID=UPI00202F21C3|nr:hypothetical protein [Rhodococcus sp. MSC1_016]